MPARLPMITETKTTLRGTRKVFSCQEVQRSAGSIVLLFVSDAAMSVGGLALPAGTVTFGHFWSDRPYNVYHWLSPDGSTLGLYFNLADRTRIGADTVEWRDLTVDLLALPGREIAVLDEDEVPADLDQETRAQIARGKHEILGHPAALIAEIEAWSRTLWPRVFGAPRP